MDDAQEKLLNDLKYAVFGVTGTNGIRGDLTGLRREFREYVKDEERRRDIEAEKAHLDALNAKREQVRNRLTAIGIVVASLGALTTAILTIAQGV